MLGQPQQEKVAPSCLAFPATQRNDSAMTRLVSVSVLLVGVASFAACSDAEPAASESYCAVAVNAAQGRINFLDDAQYASIVDDPALPDRYRDDMTAAAERARRLWASFGAWSNHDMVAVVNEMCGKDLTAVTAVP